MDIGANMLDQIKTLPHWMLVIVGITVLGICWRKSKLPNAWWLPTSLIVSTLVYPILHYTPAADQQYLYPWLSLGIHGLGIGLISYFCHDSIVAKIKPIAARFGIDFPDDPVPPPQGPAKPATMDPPQNSAGADSTKLPP